MIIDEKGKLFGKISIIDVLIILIILAAAAILTVKFTGIGSEQILTTHKTYVAEVEQIKNTTVPYIREGEKLYDNEGAYMGTVKKVEVLPGEVVKTKSNGEYAVAVNPERANVRITIEGEGKENESGFFLDGKVSLLLGTTRYFKASDVNFTAEIIEILE